LLGEVEEMAGQTVSVVGETTCRRPALGNGYSAKNQSGLMGSVVLIAICTSPSWEQHSKILITSSA
jgi:hypothetical protein